MEHKVHEWNSCFTHNTSCLIQSLDEWLYYKNHYLKRENLQAFHFPEYPFNLPCLVSSELAQGSLFALSFVHTFVYQKEAENLLRLIYDRQMED